MSTSTSTSTKDRILDVAERLFADQGIAATSLRRIMGEAGVNPAAVHYHFGGKEKLLEAVLSRRLAPVTAERLRRLAALESAGAPGLEDLLEAYVAPALACARSAGASSARFMRLFGRVHHEAGDTARGLVERLLRPVIERFAAAFGRAVPGVDPLALAWRTHFAIGSMAHTLACRDYVSWLHPDAEDLDQAELIRELVTFAAGGLRARTMVSEESP